jgi:hypothetical protein
MGMVHSSILPVHSEPSGEPHAGRRQKNEEIHRCAQDDISIGYFIDRFELQNKNKREALVLASR